MKQKLLETNLFIDNEYFEKYIELIVNNRVAYSKGKTNRHHIIPKYYYKDKGLDIDNSEENIVTLLYKDHILAHYYLSMCSKSTKDISRNALSIRWLLNGKSIYSLNLTDIDLNFYQKNYEMSKKYNIDCTHTDEANFEISNKLCGRNSPNKGNKYKKEKIINKDNVKNKKLSEFASTRIGELNSFYGKHHSDKTKAIISLNNSKKVAMIDLLSGEILKEFSSIKEASNYVMTIGKTKSTWPSSRISRVCRGEGVKAYGYGWKFI